MEAARVGLGLKDQGEKHLKPQTVYKPCTLDFESIGAKVRSSFEYFASMIERLQRGSGLTARLV